MAEYYLISQLPSLDGLNDNAPLPITEERFLELCGRLLNKKALAEIENLTLAPEIDFEKSEFMLTDKWNEGERDLRLALCKVRSEKMNKPYDLKNKNLPVELLKVANTAVESENPLEAEKYLSAYRLAFLETLRPMDSFSQEFLVYYALKLKLILRIRQLDAKAGETEYRNIYNSIINGDRLEVKQ